MNSFKEQKKKEEKNLGFLTLGKQFAIYMSTILLLACGTIGILTYNSTVDMLEYTVANSMANQIQDNIKVVTAEMESQFKALEALSESPDIKSMNWDKQKAYLEKYMNKYGFSTFTVADLSGEGHSSLGGKINIADRDYFKKALAGTSNMSAPLINRIDGKATVVVAVPIYDDDVLQGVLAAGNTDFVINQIIEKIKIAETGYAFMLSKDGVTIAHPNRDLVINQDNDFENVKNDPELQELVDLERKMVNGETGKGEYSYDGVLKYMSFAPVPGTDWSLAVTAPYSELFYYVSEMLQRIIGITLFVLLAGIIFALLIGSYIAKAINKATNYANVLATGDVSQECPEYSRKDEIGLLMIAFKNMADNIKQQAKAAEKIAAGDLDVEIIPKSEQDVLSKSMQAVVKTLRNLVSESKMLRTDAIAGKLATRGDVDMFTGGYRQIIEGVNQLLDAIVTPINEASDVLSNMAQGDLSTRVKGNYQGDFAIIKDSVNSTAQEIQVYIAEISNVLNEMANNNMNVEIEREYLGDFNQIKASINLIIDSFNSIIREIRDASEQVRLGSEGVSEASQSLSQGSTEQASSVEEISATVTQVAEQTKQNAMNANKANDIAITVSNMAEQGDAQMQEMLLAMQAINKASSDISKIIKVIDDIAFQTNILALNAAVEAARAGEHGKGFAVVAEEVRNLAARSANAAKETTDMIDDSIRKVNDGTVIANDTAKALTDILSGVSEAGKVVEEIASASNEQASAIAQISDGIMQVSNVTQANSAAAEQSASASEQMASQAELLKSLVATLKLKDDKIRGRAIEFERNNNKDNKEKEQDKTVEITLDDSEFGKY